MKKILFVLLFFATMNLLYAQSVKDKLKQAQKSLVATPTEDEIVEGLKEALNTGANTAGSTASKVDGYLKNPRLFIPFPPEAQKMKEQLLKIGMEAQVSEFEIALNRAAEDAAKKAAPIFMDAIKKMTVTDGMNILMGADTAATNFLRINTNTALYTAYKPIVQEAIQKADVTRHWNTLTTAYNKIPGVKKMNPDLEDYVIKSGLTGLFKLVADEEINIRKNSVARYSAVLKKVFNYAEVQKK
ncbi:MAG: DUF4197 domain-containing protein [Cytophagaceae bacterium]